MRQLSPYKKFNVRPPTDLEKKTIGKDIIDVIDEFAPPGLAKAIAKGGPLVTLGSDLGQFVLDRIGEEMPPVGAEVPLVRKVTPPPPPPPPAAARRDEHVVAAPPSGNGAHPTPIYNSAGELLAIERPAPPITVDPTKYAGPTTIVEAPGGSAPRPSMADIVGGVTRIDEGKDLSTLPPRPA